MRLDSQINSQGGVGAVLSKGKLAGWSLFRAYLFCFIKQALNHFSRYMLNYRNSDRVAELLICSGITNDDLKIFWEAH